MNDKSVYDILGDIRAMTVELENLAVDTNKGKWPPEQFCQLGYLNASKKHLVLINDILVQIRANGTPGYPVREFIEQLWGYDLDDALNAYERCSDPED